MKMLSKLFVSLVFCVSLLNAMKSEHTQPGSVDLHDKSYKIVKTYPEALGEQTSDKKIRLGLWSLPPCSYSCSTKVKEFRVSPLCEQDKKRISDRALTVMNYYLNKDSKLGPIRVFDNNNGNFNSLTGESLDKQGNKYFIKFVSNQFRVVDVSKFYIKITTSPTCKITENNEFRLLKKSDVPTYSFKYIHDKIPEGSFIKWLSIFKFEDGVIEIQPFFEHAKTHLEYVTSGAGLDKSLDVMEKRGFSIGDMLNCGLFCSDPHLNNAMVRLETSGQITYKLIDPTFLFPVKKDNKGVWCFISPVIRKIGKNGTVKNFKSRGMIMDGTPFNVVRNPETLIFHEIEQCVNPVACTVTSTEDVDKVVAASHSYFTNLFSRINVSEKNRSFWCGFFKSNLIYIDNFIKSAKETICKLFKKQQACTPVAVNKNSLESCVKSRSLSEVSCALKEVVDCFEYEEPSTWFCGLFGSNNKDIHEEVEKTKKSLIAARKEKKLTKKFLLHKML